MTVKENDEKKDEDSKTEDTSSSTTTQQEGKIEVEGKIGYIAELVAYQILKDKANEIGQEIDSKLEDENDKILIVPDLDFATEDIPLLHWNALHDYFNESIDEQIKESNEIIEDIRYLRPPKVEVEKVAVSEIAAAVGLAATIIGYFKTDYKIYEQPISLQDHAIFANILRCITKAPVQIFKFHRVTKSEVIDGFKGLLKKTTELTTNLNKIKVDQNLVDPESYPGLSDRIKDFITSAETFLKAFSAFADSVTKSPEDKSPPLLIKAALRKYIEKEEFTHLLNLKILSAGGLSVTSKGPFWKFWVSGKLMFIGGCAVSYILVETNGTYVSSNTYNGLADFHYDLSKDIKRDYLRPIKMLDVRTLEIDENVFTHLQQEARKKGVNPNELVTQIIKDL